MACPKKDHKQHEGSRSTVREREAWLIGGEQWKLWERSSEGEMAPLVRKMEAGSTGGGRRIVPVL